MHTTKMQSAQNGILTHDALIEALVQVLELLRRQRVPNYNNMKEHLS